MCGCYPRIDVDMILNLANMATPRPPVTERPMASSAWRSHLRQIIGPPITRLLPNRGFDWAHTSCHEARSAQRYSLGAAAPIKEHYHHSLTYTRRRVRSMSPCLPVCANLLTAVDGRTVSLLASRGEARSSHDYAQLILFGDHAA